MDIADIAVREFVEIEVDTTFGKIRSIFEEKNPKAVIVTDDGAYEGVVTQKQLLQSHLEDHTKASALAKPAPKASRTEGVRDVARMLVEGGTKVVPVFEGGDLWGIVTEDLLLEAVVENLEAITVDQIYTENVVTLPEDARMGQAINRMREHGVSRLPVVNDNGYLVGMVTTHDIVDFVTRNENRMTTGDRSGDSDRMLDMPAYDVMNEPVETVNDGATARDAVERMLDNDYAGLVVTPEDDDRIVKGIVTKTDVLRALTFTEEEHLDVQITNIDLMEAITREDVRQAITNIADKYKKMQVHHAHVRFQEHKEKLRGTPLIQCQIRLRTNRGQIAGTGEGYGSKNAFHVASDKLERNVLELKGVISDEEYRGQLLRKLGEL